MFSEPMLRSWSELTEAGNGGGGGNRVITEM